MAINVNLAGHILLDPELNGRFGVQGNTFMNTFTYFNAYFEHRFKSPDDTLSEANWLQLKHLNRTMSQLVEHEKQIQTLNTSTSNPAELDAFINTLTDHIIRLPNPTELGDQLLLPGGWQGREIGHAMLYEFTKNESGELLFSIYNSGEGLQFHEKHTTRDKTHFFPVKTYKIPTPTNAAELHHLVAKLITPQTPHNKPQEDKDRLYNAKVIYRSIEESMPFLNGEPVLVSESITQPITTSGQISGTCAQRSIHQMLKVHFDTQPHYQRFILDFKIYALREFIAEHPIPRSIEINQMVQMAIENNLKILQEPGLFDDETTKNQLADELITLKEKTQDTTATKPREDRPPLIRTIPDEYSIATASINTPQKNRSIVHGLYPNHPDFSLQQGKVSLVQQVQSLLDYCKQQQGQDPLWVIQQIESIMIHLPLPSHEKTMRESIPFYAETQDMGQVEELMIAINALRDVYQTTVASRLGVNTVPTTLVTHASFMAIYDYLDTLNAQSKGLRSFHDEIRSSVGTFVDGLKFSPHIASHHPAYDLRFKQLVDFYPSLTTQQESPLQYYQHLLASEPALKDLIKQAYIKSSDKVPEKTEQELQKNDWLELYFLFEQMDDAGNLLPNASLDKEIFKPLTQKLNQAIRMEQFVVENANILFQTKTNSRIKPKFELGLQIKFHSAITDGKQQHSWSGQTALKSYPFQLQYNTSKTEGSKTYSPIDVLLADAPGYNNQSPKKKTSNSIQLEQTHPISRDLYHLRTIQNSQIQLTLDYFISSIELLANPDIQRYVEANFMEPGVLCFALEKDRSAFLKSFDAFITQGLTHYVDQNGHMTETSLYFLRLSTAVNCYMAEYDTRKDPLYRVRLVHDQALINQTIASTVNTSLLLQLHRARFVNLVAQNQRADGPIPLPQLTEALTSLFYLQSNSTSQESLDIIAGFDLKQSERQFADLLRVYNANEPEALKSAIQTIACTCLKLPNPIDNSITGTYPTFTLTHPSTGDLFTIQAQEGQLFNANDLRLCEMPLELRNHATLKHLQLNQENMCFISMDKLTIEWPDGTVRLTRNQPNSDKLQSIKRKWTINNQEAWYEYKNPESSWGTKPLPPYLTDASADSWANEHDAFVAQNNQPRFYLSQKTDAPVSRYQAPKRRLEQLDATGQANGHLLTSKAALPPSLYAFENPDFIQVALDHANPLDGLVFLPRYGLSFHLQDQMLRLDNTHFALTQLANPPFKPEVAQITLRDNQDNQQCIIPIQRFYLDDKTPQIAGHDYQFTHDTTAIIAQEKIKSVKYGNKWTYLHSESSITYTLVNGVPQPNNAAEALYLAYIYLATHETDKAWDILTDISKRFPLKGNEQELTYLSWIVNALPCMLPTSSELAPIKSTRVSACQLKALALLTDFLAEGKKPDIPSISTVDQTHLNGHYKKANLNDVQSFYDNLNRTIESSYSELINKLHDHTHETFALSDAESKSLLTYYYKHLPENTPPTPDGTLGYEWRRLTLQTLLTEQNKLNSMQLAGQTLPPGLKKRLVEVEEKLQEEINIMGQRTILEESTVDLTLPQKRPTLWTSKSEKANRALSRLFDYISQAEEPSSKYTEAMAHLSSNISEEDFYNNVELYLQIALNKQACGLVELSIDPETHDVETLLSEIEKIPFSERPGENTSMQSRIVCLDIIIAFNDNLYYLDQVNKTIHKIELPTERNGFDQLLYDCKSKYSFRYFADSDRLKEIVARTGRTPMNYPLITHRRNLRDFCVKYLAGHRHTPIDKQDTLIPYLTNILYLALESGPAFAERYKNNKEQSRSSGINALHSSLDSTEATSISVRGPKDVFSKLLATTEDILQELRERTPEQGPIITPPNHPDATRSLAQRLFDPNHPDSPNEALDAYAHAEAVYQQQLEHARQDPEQYELSVGESQYACIQKQREISADALQSPRLRNNLLQEATKYYDALTVHLEPAWDDILVDANKLLDTTFKTQVAAGQKHRLTPQDLRKAYFHADTAHYIELTGLSADEVTALHAKIHATMGLEVNRQHANRLRKALEKIPSHGTPDPIQLAQIATILMTQNLPDAANDPAIMLFQYEEDILLRPRQLQAIKNLLSTPSDPNLFNEYIEKVIMGGGKSKVILPLLAQKKANGTNLVIMEVPRALLGTNHIDLFQTSQRLFGQKAVCFEFNRDDDCSPQRLEEIYQQFCDISTHKNYLVTTGESMQSLELKALELLRAGPKNEDQRAEWKQQVYWASKISELLKQRGDAVIDEVHQGLLHKKKLNYTLGEPKSIDRSLIDRAVNLYLFMDTLQPGIQANSTLSERVKNEWGELDMAVLLDNLLTNPASPLKQSLSVLYEKYGEAFLVGELREYFNNKKEPSFLHALEPDVKNTLAFYKEQLQLLPQTLNRQYKVQYGPSKLSNKSTANRALAIPYSANDKPNERSRFGNALETLNYSIQSLFIEGLNRELVEHMFFQWQQEARFEFLNGVYEHLDDTPTAKKVAQYLQQTPFKSLGALDTKNVQQMDMLLPHIRQSPVFLAHALSHNILPQITTEPAILHSDAYNHVSLYRSTQGLSGTPSNHTTFHQRLRFNASTSLGSDGYIQALIKHKKTAIHAIEFTQLKPYLDELLQPQRVGTDLHALIDISATFAGISNLDVTKALAAFYATNHSPLQYILYFNEADVLCAYSIEQKKTVVLASSSPDEINKQLQCTPNERFTYYDQAHTVGTDLKQAPSASALCLVDEKTQLQNFLQGAMRMRELSENQSIQMVVPPSMAGQPLENMLNTMQLNEKEQIRNDNFYATVAKLHNVMRDHALQRIASLDDHDIETKQRYVRVFDAYFVDVQQGDLFAEYGDIYAMQKPQELLDKLVSTLTQQWEQQSQTLELSYTAEDRALLQQKLQEVVTISLPHCPPLVKSPLHNNQGTEVEVEAEKEQEMKKEIEQLAEKETQRMYVSAAPYAPWDASLLTTFIQTGSLHNASLSPPINALNSSSNIWDTSRMRNNNASQSLQIDALNSACNTWDGRDPLFSPTLMMTTNYSIVSSYQKKNEIIDNNLKPIHVILYRLDENGLSSVLVSNQEAVELIKLLDETHTEAPPHVWLSTTQHTPLAGRTPEDLLTRADYHAHLEQIRYFNGNLVELLKQPTPYLWLTQHTPEKLDYFKKNIMPYRRTETMHLGRLNRLFSTPEPGFDYMAQHAFTDLTTVHWEKEYPKALPPELATLTHLARAIHHANQAFHTLAGRSEPIPPVLLSESAQAVYQAHQEKLTEIYLLLGKIESLSPDEQLLDVINPNELLRLEAFLGINLNALKTAHNIHSNTPKDAIQYQFLNVELLMLLAQSPYIGEKTKLEAVIRSNPLLIDTPNHLKLLEQYSQDNILRALLLYAHPEPETLAAIIEKTSNPAILSLGLEQEHLPESLLQTMILAKTLRGKSLTQGIQLATQEDTFRAILDQYIQPVSSLLLLYEAIKDFVKSFDPDKLTFALQPCLMLLLNNPHLPDHLFVELLNSPAFSAPLFFNLVHQKQPEPRIRLLLEKLQNNSSLPPLESAILSSKLIIQLNDTEPNNPALISKIVDWAAPILCDASNTNPGAGKAIADLMAYCQQHEGALRTLHAHILTTPKTPAIYNQLLSNLRSTPQELRGYLIDHCSTETEAARILDDLPNLTTNELHVLLPYASSNACIDKLIPLTNDSDILQTLLNKTTQMTTTEAILSKLNLPQDKAQTIQQHNEWVQRARHATTYVEFKRVIDEADGADALYENTLIHNLIDNPAFPQSLFRQLLRNPKAPVAFLDDMLSSTRYITRDSERLAILQHPSLTAATYQTIIEDPKLSEAVYSVAIQHALFQTVKPRQFENLATISTEHIISLMQHAEPPLNSSDIDSVLSLDDHWPQHVLTTLLSTRSDLTLHQAKRIALLAKTPETIDQLLLHPKANALLFNPEFADCLLHQANALLSTSTSLQLLERPDLTLDFMSTYLQNERLIVPLTQYSVKAKFVQAIRKHADWFDYTNAAHDTQLVDLFGPFIIKYYRQLSLQVESDDQFLTDLLIRNSTNPLADEALAVIANNNPKECIEQLMRAAPMTNPLGEKTFIMLLNELSRGYYIDKKIGCTSVIQFFIQQMDSEPKRTTFFSLAPQILNSQGFNSDAVKQLLQVVTTTDELQGILSFVIHDARYSSAISDDMIEPILQHPNFNEASARLIIQSNKISSSTALALIKHPVCTLDLFLRLVNLVSMEELPATIPQLNALLSGMPISDRKAIIMNNLNTRQEASRILEFICDHLSPDHEVLQKLFESSYSSKHFLAICQYMDKNELNIPSIWHGIAEHCTDAEVLLPLITRFHEDASFLSTVINKSRRDNKYIQETLKYPLAREYIIKIIEDFSSYYGDKLTPASVCLIANQEQTDDTIRLKLFNSGQPITQEALLSIVNNTQSVGVIQKVLEATLTDVTVIQAIVARHDLCENEVLQANLIKHPHYSAPPQQLSTVGARLSAIISEAKEQEQEPEDATKDKSDKGSGGCCNIQ